VTPFEVGVASGIEAFLAFVGSNTTRFAGIPFGVNGDANDTYRQFVAVMFRDGNAYVTDNSAIPFATLFTWAADDAIVGRIVSDATLGIGGVELLSPADDGPVLADGQLVGLALRKADGTLTGAITASSAANQTVTVPSVSGIAVGDLVQFKQPGGADVPFLETSDTSKSSAVYDAPDVPATTNVVPNPVGRDWGNGTLPVGWTALGGLTTAKHTGAFTQVGGASIYAADADLASGHGIQSPFARLNPSTLVPYLSAFASVYVAAGRIRVDVVIADASGTTLTVFPALPNVASSQYTGRWEQIGVSGEDLTKIAGAAKAAVRVWSAVDNTEFYLDAVQITETASQMPMVEGSGATQLWLLANDYLRKMGGPSVQYDVPFVDLARLDGTTYAGEELSLGCQVRVTEDRIPVALVTRCIALERDYLVLGSSKVTLSTLADDLTGTLARAKRPARVPVTITGADLAGLSTALAAPAISLSYEQENVGDVPTPVLLVAFTPPAVADFGGVAIAVNATGNTVAQLPPSAVSPIRVPIAWGATYNVSAWAVSRSGVRSVTPSTASLTVPAQQRIGPSPRVIVARKSTSDTSTNGAIGPRLTALGFAVTYNFAATVADCRAFPVVVVDASAWGIDATLGAFVQSLLQDGQRVFTCGNDTGTAFFPVAGAVATTGPQTPRNYDKDPRPHPSHVNWTGPLTDTDTGFVLTALISGAIATLQYAGAIGIAAFELQYPQGGVLLHDQSAGIVAGFPTAASDRLLTNSMHYLAGVLNTTRPGPTASPLIPHIDDGGIRAGSLVRSRGLSDGGYSMYGTTSDGLTAHANVKESGGKEVRRLLAKTLAGDSDSLDGLPEGSTYNRVLSTAIASGQIDLSKAGVINKLAQYLLRTGGGATLQAIVAQLTDSGHAGSSMQESGGKEIRRLLAKALAGDSDSLDGAPDGTTYRKMRRVQSAYGPVQLLFQANNLQRGSTVEGAVASYSLPGGTLSTDGDMLRITVGGRWANVGDTFRVTFGGTQLWSAPGAAGTAMFRCEIVLIRTGATTQRYVTLSISGSGPSTTQSTGTPGATLSGAVTIDFLSKDNTAASPFTVDAILVEFLGA
jgi:hypothetical protein